MSRMITFVTGIILLMTTLMLSGCGPIYKRHYEYVPPPSEQGKACITQCVQNQSRCEQMCQRKNDRCHREAQREAIYQFDAYVRERQARGEKVEKNVRDFEYTGSCNDSCNCQPAFQTCYSACGGQVIERKTCVAFCDKQ